MSSLDSGFLNAINTHKQNTQALSKTLEGLPIKYEQFDAKEINKLIEIRNVLENYKKSNIQTKEELNKITSYLDAIDIWKSKFTTGIGEANRDQDSIYYVTKNNISLRLKRSELPRGLNHVIQPFMENIVFYNHDNKGIFYPSENPVIGTVPSEYCSQEFHQFQNQEKVYADFVSQIPKFYKEGKLYFVGKPKNLYHEHPGTEIKSIF